MLTQPFKKLSSIPQTNQWCLEVKDSLKSFVKTTLQIRQEKDLESSRKNEDREYL